MAEEVIDTVVKDEMGCAFCSGSVTFGETDEGEAVFHSIPMCDNFEKMPADDFIAACRKKRDLN